MPIAILERQLWLWIQTSCTFDLLSEFVARSLYPDFQNVSAPCIVLRAVSVPRMIKFLGISSVDVACCKLARSVRARQYPAEVNRSVSYFDEMTLKRSPGFCEIADSTGFPSDVE